MSIGTFGAFTQARLAIYAAQTGLSVTGNNISNINTPGYTRQRLNQTSLQVAGSDRWYAPNDVRTGQGVLVRSISQIRNPYLDVRFREENAKVGYMNAKLEGLNSIAQILDEVGKGVDDDEGFGVVALEISNLITALQDLTKETGHQEYDNIVRQVASNLVSRLNSYASKLEEVRQNTITDFKQDVKQVNGLLESIRSYNEEIRICDIHGDPALELRDQRNLLLDELSGLIDINVTYSEEEIAPGVTVEKLTIRLGNANPEGEVATDESLLVDGVYCAQLGRPMWNTDEKTKDEFPYLRLEADGVTTTPVKDITEATILTDGEDNDNFDLVVTELKNRVGDLHKTMEKYAPKVISQADIPGNAVWKDDRFRTEVTDPATGDTNITVYKRIQATDKDGHLQYESDGKTPVYTYVKQEYKQVVSKPILLDDNDLGGELQAERELLTEKGEFVADSVIKDVDENAASKRGIQYYQYSLDLLARQLANIFNEANQGFLTDSKGNYIYKGTNDKGEEIGVPLTIDGTTYTINQNWDSMDPEAQKLILEKVKITEDQMEKTGVTYKDVLNAYLNGQEYTVTGDKAELSAFNENNRKGIFRGGVLFSNGNDSNDTTGITASNISISKDWLTEHILVRSFTCPDGSFEPASGQSDNILHMKYLLDTQKWDFYPDELEATQDAGHRPMFNGTIFEMWNDVGSTLGADQKYANTELTVAYETALSIDTDRSSVSSVDFNDEAMNLMMYSKSYNAACRLMTTIDSMIDKLINNTGLTT